ncbi:MAG: heavy-metal-associated domain-containing protein [Bacteroidota bacterium]
MKFTILLFVGLLGFSFSPASNNVSERIEKATIKTSAICEMCKMRIEEVVKELDGLVSANLDLVSRKLRVRYDADVLTVEDIRQAISNAGYKADEVLADKEAFDQLPGCCRMEGACSSGEE